MTDLGRGVRRNLSLRIEVRDALDYLRSFPNFSLSALANRVGICEAKEHGWYEPDWVAERHYSRSKQRVKTNKERTFCAGQFFSTSCVLYPPAVEAVAFLQSAVSQANGLSWSLTGAVSGEILREARQRGWVLNEEAERYSTRRILEIEVAPRDGECVHRLRKYGSEVACKTKARREIWGTHKEHLVTCNRCKRIGVAD